MTQRPCPRCHTLLTYEDDGVLIYCLHCGAPQVVLSEELLNQAADQASSEAASARQLSEQQPDLSRPIWKALIRSTAGFAVVFALFAFILPPLAAVLPAIVLAVYAARYPQTTINTALGARVGLLSGVFLCTAVLTFQTLTMLTMRYLAHNMADFDASIETTLAQTKMKLVAQSGQQAADMLTRWVAMPEFRAGGFLFGMAIIGILFLVLTVFGGTLAGFLAARRKTAT